MSLRIDGLSVRYGATVAVADMSLTVAPGEIVGLVGESGSGKSTIALAAIGLLPASASVNGTVAIDGRVLSGLDERSLDRLRGGTVGMIFQDPLGALDPLMTIGAQVAETIRLHERVSRRAAGIEAAALLIRVGLAVPPSRFPNELSGGQRQRVAIAIAIAGNPSLLIADEPTSALDVTTQAHIVALLRTLVVEGGMGLLLVSHDLALVAAQADRIVVMHEGQAVEAGATRDVLVTPRHDYTRRLLAKARHVPERPPPAEGPPLLEVSGLSRHYPGAWAGFRRRPPIRAVEAVSFVVRRGESVGLIGGSGAGKSSLLRAVLGLERPQAGEVRLHGEPLVHARGRTLRRLRRDVQAVFQDPLASFDPRHDVARIISEPLHLVDVPLERADRQRRIDAALDRVGLARELGARLPHALSGGQRQRVGLARALIVEPALLVLDEAVSALDASIRADILDLLADLNARLGIALLFVSHDLAVMRAATDRLLVMQAGRIVEEGPTAAVIAAPRHPHTAELVAATPDLKAVLRELRERP